MYVFIPLKYITNICILFHVNLWTKIDYQGYKKDSNSF
jgi:hypothetical protein